MSKKKRLPLWMQALIDKGYTEKDILNFLVNKLKNE